MPPQENSEQTSFLMEQFGCFPPTGLPHTGFLRSPRMRIEFGSATPNTLILVLRDAVEVPVSAEENLTVGNGWRRVARLAQVIHGQKFELLRIGPKNGGDASSARDIQPPGCHHHRTPAFSAREPLGPPDFSGLA